MTEQLTIEERLTNVEEDLAAMKRSFTIHKDDNKSWIEAISGTFKDDPDFDEIVELGQQFRQSEQ
jgi:hypothetical protein